MVANSGGNGKRKGFYPQMTQMGADEKKVLTADGYDERMGYDE